MSIHRSDPVRTPPPLAGLWSQSSQSCDFCGKHITITDLYAVKTSVYIHARYACIECVTKRKLKLGKISQQRYLRNTLKGQAS